MPVAEKSNAVLFLAILVAQYVLKEAPDRLLAG
jgi:hypothetical protein